MLNDWYETQALAAAREQAAGMALDDIDVTNWALWESNSFWPFFERLRRDDPVHYHPDSHHGPFWSVTRFQDIKAVDTNHRQFSSEDNITLRDSPAEFFTTSFISMDPPKHDVQRKTVAPVVGPRNLAALEHTIRQRVVRILDSLPVGEPFNWVEAVSIELTTQMLATLFDFPFEDRRQLTRWSDVATLGVQADLVPDAEAARAELRECLAYFTVLFEERGRRPPGNDVISMLAHGPATRDMPPMEFLGNLLLLIIGGNDTTRNSISGGVLALNLFPDQFRRLRRAPELIPNLVAEIIRWQTPLAHMRRTALEDVELGGKRIRAGDKVAMWYVSGNRDETVFEQADRLCIDRANARAHLSFGYGIHRCMGNRLAEMQLRILWEELLPRFRTIEVVGPPEWVRSNFVKGYAALPVVVEHT